MRCRLILACLAIPLTYASAQEPLGNWTYSTDNPFFGKYKDVGGTRLSDGKMGRGDTVIFSGGQIVLNIDLRGPARVSEVRAHLHRHNNNYKCSRFVVLAKEAGQWVEVGRATGFWGPTEQRDFVLSVADIAVTTGELQLRFATASLLAISELEIIGERVAEDSGARSRGLGASLPLSKGAGPTVSEQDLDGDGKAEVILENAFVRMIFAPARGGVCVSLIEKRSGAELVAPSGPGYGLLRDQLWEPKYSFADRFYFTNLAQKRDSASVELWAAGAGGILSFTELHKTITLTRDSAAIRVHYELKNDPSSQTDFSYGMWFHNFLGVAGQTNTYYVPTEEGVQEFRFAPALFKKELSDIWYRDPARGWTAVVSESGPGLAAQVPFKYLNCFYHWTGVTSLVATHEWRYNKVLVKSGDAFTTDIVLYPFAKMPRVDAAGHGFVAAVEVQDQPAGAKEAPATVTLWSAASEKNVRVALRCRSYPRGEWQALETKLLDLRPGESASLSATVPAPAAGMYVVSCRVSRGKKPAIEFERPFAVGQTAIAYHLAPLEKRVGEKATEAAYQGHELSDEVVTPHIPWAKPYAGGTIKALTLVEDSGAREIIELAERLSLDFTYVKFLGPPGDKGYLYEGDRSIRSLAQAQKRLLQKLDADYDVIIIAGLQWDYHFTPQIRKKLLDKVRAGAGLIYISPLGVTGDLAACPAFAPGGKRNMNRWYKWAPEGEGAITDALPWDLFPKTRRFEYDQPPQGDVLATLGDDKLPLIAAGRIGKGRALAVTWDVLTHTLTYRGYGGLTPILSYRGGYLQAEFAQMRYPYWELWYALIARMVTWAADRETGIHVAEMPPVTAGPDDLGRKSISLTLAGGKGQPVEVEFGFWAPDDRLLATEKAQAKATEGATIKAALPKDLRAGLNLVHAIVRDPQGQVHAWAAGYVNVQMPCAISEVSLDDEDAIYLLEPDPAVPPGSATLNWHRGRLAEPIAGTVKLTALGGEGRTLTISLLDSFGRLVGREERPLGRRSGAADPLSRRFEFKPDRIVSVGHEVVVELREGDRVLDSRRKRLICIPPRDWNRFTFTSWSGQYLWRTYYLFDFVNRQVEDLGLSSAFNSTTEYAAGKVWRDYWHNIIHSDLGLLSYLGKGVPDFQDRGFSKKATGWAQSKDKKFLVRTPCLNDPEWRAAVKASLQERLRDRLRYGGCFDYCMGDEMSLTYYTRFHDFCFSEHCLAKFRQWLKDLYGTLDALNAAWETDFPTWDDVMPMTVEEVRDRDNAAPWADHRTFMNDTLADFFGFVQDALREIDPDAKCGLSGTQAPEAGNGMDWWKLSKAFSYYHSYNTGWSDEMRRSFQPATGVMASPYRAGYWQQGARLEYQMFWCLLHDTQGVSAWTTKLFFYPDLTLSESGRDTRANIRELEGGVWDLIRHAKRQQDGIAIHYSQPSINAAFLLGKNRDIADVRAAWVKLLEDNGLQYDFLSYAQIEQGALATPTYKVLILPMSIALSAREVTAIRHFAAEGGTVIADQLCGLMDDHCRRQPRGLLDDLFGVERRAGEEVALANEIVMSSALGGLKAGDRIKLSAAESRLRASDAKPLGAAADGGPRVLFLKQHGKGRAAYLNLDLSQYESERKFGSPTERQMRQIVLGLLSSAGLQPKVGVTFKSGKLPHCEVVRYRDADLEYVGILRDASGQDEVATIRLPRKAHVYDVRQSKYLGEMDSLTVPISPGQCRLFCLSPSRLPEPTLKLLSPKKTKPGDALRVTVALSANPPGPQLARLSLVGPDGAPREWSRCNVLLAGEPVQLTIPLGLNAAPGEWDVRASDLLTGQTAQASVTVGD